MTPGKTTSVPIVPIGHPIPISGAIPVTSSTVTAPMQTGGPASPHVPTEAIPASAKEVLHPATRFDNIPPKFKETPQNSPEPIVVAATSPAATPAVDFDKLLYDLEGLVLTDLFVMMGGGIPQSNDIWAKLADSSPFHRDRVLKLSETMGNAASIRSGYGSAPFDTVATLIFGGVQDPISQLLLASLSVGKYDRHVSPSIVSDRALALKQTFSPFTEESTSIRSILTKFLDGTSGLPAF
jgi:hypothetical protein